MENPRETKKEKKPSFLDENEERVALLVEVMAGGLAFNYLAGDALKSAREAVYHARHAANTVADAAKGGPEGMRAAENLEQAIEMVETAAQNDTKASEALREYYSAHKGFVKELLNVYNESETLARVCTRLEIQLKGMAKNLFEFGNDLKPGWWKENVDLPIVIKYAKTLRYFGDEEYKDLTDDEIVAKALESSDNLKEFYQNAREFYDAREKSETTVKEFCDYITEVRQNSQEKMKQIEQKLIDIVKEGVSTEDYIFDLDAKGAELTKADVEHVDEVVAEYDANVDETREEVGQEVPLQPYSKPIWIDAVTNPFVLGAATVLAAKGISRLFLPRFVDKAISYGVCYPLRLAGKAGSFLYSKIPYIHGKKGDNK
jgi:hypothetical protein